MTPITPPTQAQVNEVTNPLAHLIGHVAYASREAVMQEIINVWSTHQDSVRFESFVRRMVDLRHAVGDAEFQRRVCDLVLWFGHEQPYVDRGESHKVSNELLESDLLRSSSSILYALSDPATIWRVHVQADKSRVQISDPRLSWLGRDAPWLKVRQFCTRLDSDPKYGKWRSAVYIRDSDGEPYRVSWINADSGEMSCESPRGAFSVRSLLEWRERWLR